MRSLSYLIVVGLLCCGCSVLYDGSRHTVNAGTDAGIDAAALECVEHDDCDTDDGEICIDGSCEEECSADADCESAEGHPWGPRCMMIPGAARQCGCGMAADCSAGEVCDPEVRICLEIEACTGHLDCDPARTMTFCRNGACSRPNECESDPDCVGGWVCTDLGGMGMRCFPTCPAAGFMCPPSTSCDDAAGRCVPD